MNVILFSGINPGTYKEFTVIKTNRFILFSFLYIKITSKLSNQKSFFYMPSFIFATFSNIYNAYIVFFTLTFSMNIYQNIITVNILLNTCSLELR